MIALAGTGWAILRGSWALQLATAIGLGLLAFKANNTYREYKGGQAVIAKSEKAGKVANEKASEAHDAATRPGAVERLRKSACRDCK